MDMYLVECSQINASGGILIASYCEDEACVYAEQLHGFYGCWTATLYTQPSEEG